jgi:hypothetical protein
VVTAYWQHRRPSLAVTYSPPSRPAAGARVASERFARLCAHVGFDDPEWFMPRRAAVLKTLEAASRLTRSQLRVIVRAQRPRLALRGDGRAVRFDGASRAAHRCLREESRLHGRLVALGQAWAGSNRLVGLLTARQPLLVVRITASAVAGEALCRALEDLDDRRVLGCEEEPLLRQARRAAYPPPTYVRRPHRER